jgi:tRNA threonylcarbamoyladenosine biosynthesis protein TsaB
LKIISFETSGKTFGISASLDNKPVGEVFWDSGQSHSEKLVSALEWMLGQLGWEKQEIDKIGVSTGPGSFTGIRVGLSCARMLAQGLGIPVAGVDSLTVLEKGAECFGVKIVPAIDALREELYVKDKKGNVVLITVAEFIDGLKKLKTDLAVAGSGSLVYGERIQKELKGKVTLLPYEYNLPDASTISKLAFKMKGTSYKKATPLYIRRSWAEEKK